MIWDYLVELDIITRIFIGEEGRMEDGQDGRGGSCSVAKSSVPLLDLMESSPWTPPTKAWVPPNL